MRLLTMLWVFVSWSKFQNILNQFQAKMTFLKLDTKSISMAFAILFLSIASAAELGTRGTLTCGGYLYPNNQVFIHVYADWTRNVEGIHLEPQTIEFGAGYPLIELPCTGSTLSNTVCEAEENKVRFDISEQNEIIAMTFMKGVMTKEIPAKCQLESAKFADKDFVWDSTKISSTGCKVGGVKDIRLEDLDRSVAHGIEEKALRHAWLIAGTCPRGASPIHDETRVRLVCEQPYMESVVFGFHFSCPGNSSH